MTARVIHILQCHVTPGVDMLSEHHRQQVKATVPLLEAGGEALTRHF